MILAVEAGNAATWAGVVVALIVAVVGIVQGRKQTKISKEASEANHRQAEAAERRAIAVESALAEALSALQPQPGVDSGAKPSPSVSWVLERRGKHKYFLRNTGNTTATGVRVDPERLASITRNVPENASVPPGASTEFVMAGSLGAPLPGEIWLTWDGQAESQAIPLRE